MIYVDTWNAPYRGMVMCHLGADTHDELLQIVDAIGVDRKWIQYPGTWREHFDICLTKKKQALALGAVELSPKDFVRRQRLKRIAQAEER